MCEIYMVLEEISKKKCRTNYRIMELNELRIFYAIMKMEKNLCLGLVKK